jgi:hypothetical protein
MITAPPAQVIAAAATAADAALLLLTITGVALLSVAVLVIRRNCPTSPATGV